MSSYEPGFFMAQIVKDADVCIYRWIFRNWADEHSNDSAGHHSDTETW